MHKYLVVAALAGLAFVSTSASAADAGAAMRAQSADALVPSLVAAPIDLSIAEPVTLAQVALGGIGFDAAVAFSASAPAMVPCAYEATAPPRAAAVSNYSITASGPLTAANRSTG